MRDGRITYHSDGVENANDGQKEGCVLFGVSLNDGPVSYEDVRNVVAGQMGLMMKKIEKEKRTDHHLSYLSHDRTPA